MTTQRDSAAYTALLKTEEATRIEVARLTTRIVAERNKLAALHRALDTRAPGWRDRVGGLLNRGAA